MKKPFFQRLRNHLTRMFRHPVKVFVFHQVSDVFDPETMWDCDWTQTDVFKERILALKKKYTFIPLSEVPRSLANDKCRLKKYASLTADDGWASLHNILPWLTEQQIPVTLFLNPSCLDGKHWNSRATDKLLTKEEVILIVEKGTPYITVASHGWTHKRCDGMTMETFTENVDKAEKALEGMPGKVPFYAFASGLYTRAQVDYLRRRELIPVFVDGMVNDRDPASIHRFCMDGGASHE